MIYSIRGPRTMELINTVIDMEPSVAKDVVSAVSDFKTAGVFFRNFVMGLHFRFPGLKDQMTYIRNSEKEVTEEIVPKQMPMEVLRVLVQWPMELSECELFKEVWPG